MHLVADVLGLACNQLLLLALDVALLVAVVRDDEVVDILDELLLHAALQRLESVRQEIVAGLDVVVAVELDGLAEGLHALVDVVGDWHAWLRLGEQDDDHVLGGHANISLPLCTVRPDLFQN